MYLTLIILYFKLQILLNIWNIIYRYLETLKHRHDNDNSNSFISAGHSIIYILHQQYTEAMRV